MGGMKLRWATPVLIIAVLVALPAAAAAKKPGKSLAVAKKPTKPVAKGHDRDGGDHARGHVVGAFYTTTNGTPNQLLVFARYSDGTITKQGSVPTGGNGGYQGQPINVMAPPPVCTGGGAGCPALDSQGALGSTPDRKLLFTVNAGSNTVSSFRVTDNGPVLVSQVSSGGTFPNSLTVHGNLLYVLNSNSLSIQGMRFDSSGTLSLIGGPQALNPSGTAPGSPHDIEFDNTGHWLIVDKLVNPGAISPVGTIDTFAVNLNGTVGAPVSSNSTDVVPFAIGFDAGDNALIATIGNPFAFQPGSLASYSIGSTGSLTNIASTSTIGYAPCWIVTTNDRSYAYIVNADILGPAAPSVSTFKLPGNGQMQYLGTTASLGDQPIETDPALSRDNQYLYVAAPIDDRAFGSISHIDVFKIGPDHQPRLIQQTPFNLAKGLTGAVAS